MLIIEDDYLTQKVLYRLFHKDFDIETFESAEDFYEGTSGKGFDIIILDISIKGGISGLELTKNFRQSSTYQSTPILCFTAHAFLKDRKTAMDSGIDLFVTKPVPNNVLINSVKYLLSENRN